jgi:hypothetical protein
LISSPSRLQDLHAAIQGAASSTALDLRTARAFPWDLSVPRVSLCPLSEFPQQAVFCGEEMMASVLVSYRGRFLGSSVISLEPPHALGLIQSLEALEAEGEPLEIFRTTGASVLQGILGGLDAGGGRDLEFGNPIFEEGSLVATLLGTHAPRDTMVVSLELDFSTPRQAFPAYLYLLLDVKALESSLGSLPAPRQ